MANYTLQSHGGEGLYMTADGTPTARRNVYKFRFALQGSTNQFPK